jgi:hypothetical protein
MAVRTLELDRDYVFSHCTKYLARSYRRVPPRHNYNNYPEGDQRASIAEAWRFPVIDALSDVADSRAYASNAVTFVYFDSSAPPPGSVGVIGTFANLYEPVPLQRVGTSPYFAVTAVVAKGSVHTYKYIVDGRAVLDPVNPQRTRLDNGVAWSRFFTWNCTAPVSFERRERDILTRLAEHILPFNSQSGRNFLDRYYFGLDHDSRDSLYPNAYRLDENVGVANYIDKLVAREELHHLVDYKICLDIIDRVLRRRDPYVEPRQAPREIYIQLYNEMATDRVDGWDYSRYNSPRYFLSMLRRHTVTGAFSHPKYGGNAGAAGWSYLEDRYRKDSATLFAWRKHQEPPLGDSNEYRG